MAELACDLFCEDLGHENFTRALAARLCEELGVAARVLPRNARGGLGRAVQELRAWQRGIERLDAPRGDLLVVVLDANQMGSAAREREIESVLRRDLFPAVAIGCPDPYVERWYYSDPQAWRRAIGAAVPAVSPSDRTGYERLLDQAIRDGGQLVLNDYSDFAVEVVQEMDHFRAGKSQPSLGRFVDQLRAGLRLASAAAGG